MPSPTQTPAQACCTLTQDKRGSLRSLCTPRTQAFEMGRNNPFNFRCLRTLNRADQLSTLQAGPKVRVADEGWGLTFSTVCRGRT